MSNIEQYCVFPVEYKTIVAHAKRFWGKNFKKRINIKILFKMNRKMFVVFLVIILKKENLKRISYQINFFLKFL